MGTGYLTADSVPTGKTCRSLFIPDDGQFIANIRGLLQTMTQPESFAPFGLLSPAQMANAYVDMFDDFCFEKGPCKMIGEIVIWSGTANPKPGIWLPCDGASLLRASYPALFVVIGTVYGAADGTHFNVPDVRGRAIVGVGHGSGLTDRALGDTYGEETHTLITAEIPSHTHNDAGHAHSESSATPSITSISPGAPEPTAVPGISSTGVGYASLSNTGGGNPHENIQPSFALKYLIVALDG